MSHRKYWIKSVGLPGDPIKESWYKEIRQEIHFPLNPRSINQKDWLFIYAVGLQKIVGVFEVDSPVDKFSDSQKEEADYKWREQFPYFIFANSLFNLFSLQWEFRNINPNLLDDNFTRVTGLPVTMHGNDSINGLQHGHSHIELTKEFAGYLLDEMKSSFSAKDVL